MFLEINVEDASHWPAVNNRISGDNDDDDDDSGSDDDDDNDAYYTGAHPVVICPVNMDKSRMINSRKSSHDGLEGGPCH